MHVLHRRVAWSFFLALLSQASMKGRPEPGARAFSTRKYCNYAVERIRRLDLQSQMLLRLYRDQVLGVQAA